MSGARPKLKRLCPKPFLLLMLLSIALVASQPVQAQYTFSDAYTFTGASDGATPNAAVVMDSKGNLYGTATYGGDTSGSNCTGLGILPTGCGVVFQLIPPTGGSGPWTENVIYTFTGGSDGAYPQAGLVFDSNGINLYGTASLGGDTSGTNCPGLNPPTGCGVVFELSPPSGGQGPWTETVLYAFTGSSCSGQPPVCNGTDGTVPDSGLIFDSGNLYGTTAGGGVVDNSVGYGVVYELSPPSGGSGPWTENLLYTFSGGSDGGSPYAGLIMDKTGNFYGTTSGGGDLSGTDCHPRGGCGVVFELSPPSGGSGPWTENVLYTFTNSSDGAVPYAGVVFDSKGVNLYGTTSSGGNLSGANCKYTDGCGVVYELSPPSGGSGPWTLSTLYTYTGGNDGGFPYAGVIFDSKGNLYGTTSGGGNTSGSNCNLSSGCGVALELSPPAGGGVPWVETLLYTFSGGSDGASPSAGLILDSKGNLYGTAAYGGDNSASNCQNTPLGCGVVFELALTNAPQVTLSPTSLNFGNVIVGQTGPAKAVTVTNTGMATLIFSSITASGDFTISFSTCKTQLAVGKSCKVNVTFTPEQLGQLSGTLTFTDNAPNSPQTVPLSGTGVSAVALTPASAKFGKVKVGATSKAKTFTLTNNQSTTLTNIAISTTGDFGVSSTTCGSTLGAGQKCTISVTFKPTQKGARTGELIVNDSALGSPQTANLSGTGT